MTAQISDLTRDACTAIDAYEATRRRAAAEVGTDQRHARAHVTRERSRACAALARLATALPPDGYRAVRELAEAVTDGYSTDNWPLRVARTVATYTTGAPC